MFNQIVAVDAINLSNNVINQIRKFSKKPAKFYNSDPKNTNQTTKRINNADCVLISWRTIINKQVFKNCENIKYIGVCGTSFANVDIIEAKRRKIVISNVRDYGDEGTGEYIFSQLLNLARGFGKYQWKSEPCELFGKTLGVVGVGPVGSHLAKIGLGFGMNVIYFSRTRKLELEKRGVNFVNLHDLIKKSDVISLHVPKNTPILSKKEFDMIPSGTILVNTCLGKVFDEKDFISWIKKGNNFAIFDYSVSVDYYKKFKGLKNVIFPKIIAGRTLESKQRLSKKVVENIRSILNNNPINVIY